jgi:hypothetical protein
MRPLICVSVNMLLCGGGACLCRHYVGEYTAFMYIGAYIGLVVAEVKGM